MHKKISCIQCSLIYYIIAYFGYLNLLHVNKQLIYVNSGIPLHLLRAQNLTK